LKRTDDSRGPERTVGDEIWEERAPAVKEVSAIHSPHRENRLTLWHAVSYLHNQKHTSLLNHHAQYSHTTDYVDRGRYKG
jgi:hypothetical protein